MVVKTTPIIESVTL